MMWCVGAVCLKMHVYTDSEAPCLSDFVGPQSWTRNYFMSVFSQQKHKSIKATVLYVSYIT